MVYLICNEKDSALINSQVLPCLKGREVRLVHFPGNLALEQKDDFVYIAFLNDTLLKQFLPFAAQNGLQIGILPHPEAASAILGFGIKGNLKTVLDEIFNPGSFYKSDLLYADGIPVFHSVNIGNVFLLKNEEKRNNFFFELYYIIKNVIKISALRHTPFTFVINGENPIKTSAIGIIIVEHSLNSVIFKNVIPKSALNDGAFHVLIIAPENILELMWFMFLNVLSGSKAIENLPEFIGQLKVDGILIKSSEGFNFSIDGEKRSSDEICFEVKKETLYLRQRSIYKVQKEGPESRRRIKTEQLPKGAKRIALVKKPIPFFRKATHEEFDGLFSSLRKNSQPRATFLVMLILSTLIAVFGLFANSTPVIIGAMILAPIITPIVAFSMGMVRNDIKLLKVSLTTIFVGSFFAVFFSALLSAVIPLKEVTPEIYSRLSPNLLDLGIAVASGIAAAYAHSKEEIAKTLAGVAIAVALVPPLAVAGIGIGWNSWYIFSGAFLLYVTNLSGIILFAGITFFFFGFTPFDRAKRGLIYSLLTLLLIAVPLSFAFKKMLKESALENRLKGISVNEVTVREVGVRYGKPVKITLRVTSSKPIEEETISNLKFEIEKQIEEPVQLEIHTAYEFLPSSENEK